MGCQKILKIQKRILRYMLKVPPRTSCRPLFRKLQLFTLPCLYVYELVLYVKSNPTLFRRSEDLHSYNTRNKNLLLYPTHKTALYESSPFYKGMTLYNKTLKMINIKGTENLFKAKLKEFLLQKAYYSVKEFLDDV